MFKGLIDSSVILQCKARTKKKIAKFCIERIKNVF